MTETRPYTTTRMTTRGTLEISDVATNALSMLGLNRENSLPIIDNYGYNNNNIEISSSSFLPDYYKNEENKSDYWELTKDETTNKFELILYIDKIKTYPPLINNELNESLKASISRPLIFLITSKAHAILCIYYNTKWYTIGFGYSEHLQLNDPERRNLLINFLNSLGSHSVEILRAGLYTADYLLPTEKHESKISYIDYLNKDMIERLQYTLNFTRYIRYSGLILEGTNDYKLSNNLIIALNLTYLESVGIIQLKKTYNCLEWAKYILFGPNPQFIFHCIRPANCRGITQEQWNIFLQTYNQAITTRNDNNLNILIDEIQDYLLYFECDENEDNFVISGGIRKNKTKKNINNK